MVFSADLVVFWHVQVVSYRFMWVIARLGYMEQPLSLLLRGSTIVVFTSCRYWFSVVSCIDDQSNVVIGCIDHQSIVSCWLD